MVSLDVHVHSAGTFMDQVAAMSSRSCLAGGRVQAKKMGQSVILLQGSGVWTLLAGIHADIGYSAVQYCRNLRSTSMQTLHVMSQSKSMRPFASPNFSKLYIISMRTRCQNTLQLQMRSFTPSEDRAIDLLRRAQYTFLALNDDHSTVLRLSFPFLAT